jgi:hypothetical protein
MEAAKTLKSEALKAKARIAKDPTDLADDTDGGRAARPPALVDRSKW